MLGLKSYAEFVRGTYNALIVDCALQYPELAKEFKRDYSRLSSAIDEHGISFALDVMPRFRKHFDKCLDNGRLIPSNLLHFGVDKRKGPIPRLFRGLILRVFNRDGILQHCPDLEAIRLLRQLLGVFKRMRIDSSPLSCYEAAEEFIRTDMEVRHGTLDWASRDSFVPDCDARLSFLDHLDSSISHENQLELALTDTPSPLIPRALLEKVQQVADLITATLGSFDPCEWRLRHGPGAISDQKFGSYKYEFKHWSDRLSNIFPRDMFAHANLSLAYDEGEVEKLTSGSHSNDLPSRLIAVPKTLLKPRLIASEPTSYQWCQQAVKDYFYTRARQTFVGSFVDFRRQDLNGRLALSASRSGSHATIDLSSASDLVSCWHVERLFRRSPSLLQALQATRSAWIGQEISSRAPRYHMVRKYSTMGNATIFPVQSLFFLSLALGSLAYARDLKVGYKMMRSLGKMEVRVFGDDIIVPKDCSGTLVELIGALGLRVNSDKTFLNGLFRESCGVDAYGGHDVTTVSILDVPRRASPGSIVSSVDVHHNLCNAGLVTTAAFIQKTAARAVSDKIRYVKHGSGLFGWSDLFGESPTLTKVKWDTQLQRRVVRTFTTCVVEERIPPTESSGLLQFFTEAAKTVTSAVSTLGYLGQRPQAKLRLGWAPSY